MSFSALINNTWVVGIVGGILSGLVTYWIIQKLFSGKTKKEYLKSVEATNREIVYSLRSAISDNVHHEQKVIEGLISSTARKNGVLVKDIYSIKQIAEDLIKEVMDSSFIPSAYKKEYCDNLINLYFSKSTLDTPNTNGTNGTNGKIKQTSKFDESIMTTVSLLFGVMAAGSTMLLTIKGSFFSPVSSEFLFGIKDLFNQVVNILLPVVISLISLLVVFLFQYVNKKDKQKNIRITQIIHHPKDKHQAPTDGDNDRKE